jgi:Short C-terminal domain
VGLFDFLSRRRQRESAVAGSMSSGDAAADVEIGTASAEQEGVPSIPGLGNLGDLGKLIQQAMTQGNVQVTQGSTEAIDLRGQDDQLRTEILETLREHGVDAHKGDEIRVTDPELQQAIFAKLAAHGVNVGSAGEGFGADAGGGALIEDDRISGLERIAKLRESGALTEAEFQTQKQKLLGE